MMSRFEPRTSCILSCMLYCYATSVNSVVIGMDRTRYIINRKDMSDVQGGSHAAPRSGHDVAGLDINLNLDLPEAEVGCEAMDLEAVIWLQTAA